MALTSIEKLIFYSYERSGTEDYNRNYLFQNSRMLSMSLKSSMEYPLFLWDMHIDAVHRGLSTESLNLNIPIFVNENVYRVYSSIATFINNFPLSPALCKTKIKDDVYYVGKGIVLYEDLSPIFSLTLQVSKVEGGLYKVDAQNCYINKRVFSENDIISKWVKTQLLPKLSVFSWEEFRRNTTVWRYRRYNNCNFHDIRGNYDFNFKIKIEEMPAFIEIPTTPNISFNDNIKDFLLTNINEL